MSNHDDVIRELDSVLEEIFGEQEKIEHPLEMQDISDDEVASILK